MKNETKNKKLGGGEGGAWTKEIFCSPTMNNVNRDFSSANFYHQPGHKFYFAA